MSDNKSPLAIVTGASSGIGRAVSLKLLQQDWQVLGLSRRVDDELAAMPGFSPFQLDFSDIERLPEALERLQQQLAATADNNMQALVACAGRGQFGGLEEFSYSQMRELMDLNFLSQAMLVKALLPIFKRQKLGDIIFIGSEAALKGARKGSLYCASKFAIRGFAQALRDECARSGVRVGIVNPGMVASAFFDNLDFIHGEEDTQFIRVEDVAEAVGLMLQTPGGTVIDEINLSPLKNVVRNKDVKT